MFTTQCCAQAEVERLLFEDPDPETGFMLHPDLKWDQTHPQSLYCIALCHRCLHWSLCIWTGEAL